MPSFDEDFFNSKGKPITYKGNTLIRHDEFPVAKKGKIVVVIESTNSEWKQGIGLRTDKSLLIKGYKKVTDIAIWDKVKNRPIEIFYESKNNKILVWNIWDSKRSGGINFWLNGSAMIVEELPNGRRYKCNDAHPDDNFDDIIFRIERC
ncbi:MAG: hypothetical protein AB1414_17260 [bacterium]